MAKTSEKTKQISSVDNPIEWLRRLQAMDSEIKRYFYFDSKLFRAVRDHIAEDADCVLIDREAKIVMNRGTGPAISFKEAWLYGLTYVGKTAVEPEIFSYRITIEYYDEENERQYDREYSIGVPTDLEINFSTEKFQTWVDAKRQERNAKRAESDLKILKKLVETYPNEAKRLLKGK